MEELIKGLTEKLGLNQGVAEKIGGFLQENAASVPQLLSGDSSGIQQMMEKVGIDKGQADKVVGFLKENSAHLPAWLGDQGGGILQKVKDLLGGVLGSKESK
jgi:hypothetical protein